MARIKVLVAGAIALFACVQAWAASPIEIFRDNGKATFFYGADLPSDPMNTAEALKRGHTAERMAAVANSALLLRHNLQVGFESCGSPGAFFSPQRESIVICYEFIQMMVKLAAADEKMREMPKERFAKIFDGALWSVFLHELGHAVIYINKVPATGRAEDVADQFGAWFALNFMPQDRLPVVVPSLWLWTRLAKQRDLPSMSDEQRRQFLANEHSLDEQRVYNIACMAVGAYPSDAQPLITAVSLPAERAQRCAREYADVDFAMQKGFRKFLKVKPLRGSW